MDNELIILAEQLGQALKAKNLKVAAAESCTGGTVCQLITEIAGSSEWFDCGFITYSNHAKMQMLGVNPKTLENFGAVSKETALEMTAGVLQHSQADYAVSVTGIAGPGGGSAEKPVGTVFIAFQSHQKSMCYEQHFSGNRYEIRQQTVKFVLNGLLKFITTYPR